ncbi:MAG: enoyl-CoA hydratase/isomerase family protein [Caulobacterales bacterium]|nr:enoyl-CoA hydratase/isomerase family protein [Caulobacterales bacterium]
MTIHFSRPAPHVALIELDLPPTNALGAAMRGLMSEGLAAIEADADARCVVLTGRGRVFCAGNDLRELAGRAEGDLSPISDFNALIGQVEALRMPVIAAVSGGALGGGLDLALACDIRLAAEGASFTASGVNVGLMASVGRLPSLIGTGPAKAMLLTGSPVDAATALRFGLVTGLYPADQLLDEALALAARIAGRAPLAVEAAKRFAGMSPDDRALWMDATLASLAGSDDHREAVASFLEKRAAVFTRQ